MFKVILILIIITLIPLTVFSQSNSRSFAVGARIPLMMGVNDPASIAARKADKLETEKEEKPKPKRTYHTHTEYAMRNDMQVILKTSVVK